MEVLQDGASKCLFEMVLHPISLQDGGEVSTLEVQSEVDGCMLNL